MSFRIGGIASGMDTESIVRDLMRVQRMPLQRLEQDKQVWQWRQEDYRSLNMNLLALRNKAFDMVLSTPYSAKKVTSSNDNVLSVTAGASANTAAYNISVTNLASSVSTYSTKAVNGGTNVNVKASLASWIADPEIKPTDTFSFYLQGSTGATGTVSDFNVDRASDKGVRASGSADLGPEGGLSIRANTAGELLNGYKVKFVSDETQEGVSVNINEDDKVIKVTANLGDEDLKLADLTQAINGTMNSASLPQVSLTATGEYALVDFEDREILLEGGANEVPGQYSFSVETPFVAGEYITIGGQSFKGVTGTADASKGEFSVDGGKASQNASLVEAINANKSLSDRFQPAKIEDGKIILTEIDGKVTGRDITSPVNGIGFEFTYGDSLEKVITTVNSNKLSGVSMFFDESENKLVVTSRETGADQEINIGDNVGNFIKDVMKLDTTNKKLGEDATEEEKAKHHYHQGTDAVFTLNGLGTSRSSNSFQINNVTFNLKNVGDAKVEIQEDTDKVVENIKEFVELYNKTIDEVYGKLNEEKFRKFPPLTQDQRADMSEKDIELWEEKAKSGLLQRDSVLSNSMNALRRAMSSTIDGLEINSIFNLGMKTGSYQENGKIYINEEKLKEAIENNPEGVMKLFNNNEEGSLGIARQLQNELDNTMERISERAGSSTNIYDQSTIGRTLRNIDDQMLRMEDRLMRMEERYWKQFTAMEQALQAMYQQSDWLAQQLMSM